MKRLFIVCILFFIVIVSTSSAKKDRSRHNKKSHIYERTSNNRTENRNYATPRLMLRAPGGLSTSSVLQPPTYSLRAVKLGQEELCDKGEILGNKSLVRCMPRDTIVLLDSKIESILSPSAVLVKRCNGACSIHHKCVATRWKTTKFNVREIKLNSSRCMEIEVVEDLMCSCSCPQRRGQCNPNQTYDEDQCKCLCPYDAVRQKCDNPKMIMDREECVCRCKKARQCTSGTQWDATKCRCIKKTARKAKN